MVKPNKVRATQRKRTLPGLIALPAFFLALTTNVSSSHAMQYPLILHFLLPGPGAGRLWMRWTRKSLNRGEWHRHCTNALRKQVLPKFSNPAPARAIFVGILSSASSASTSHRKSLDIGRPNVLYSLLIGFCLVVDADADAIPSMVDADCGCGCGCDVSWDADNLPVLSLVASWNRMRP